MDCKQTHRPTDWLTQANWWTQKSKNPRYVKKVGHTSEFLFAFIDELEKQIIIKKPAEVGQ